MAERMFDRPRPPVGATLLYENNEAVSAGSTLNLSDSIYNYSFLFMIIYNGTPGYATRGYLYIPSMGLDAGLGSYPAVCATTSGYLRLQKDSATVLNLFGTSFSTLYVTQIYGLV